MEVYKDLAIKWVQKRQMEDIFPKVFLIYKFVYFFIYELYVIFLKLSKKKIMKIF